MATIERFPMSGGQYLSKKGSTEEAGNSKPVAFNIRNSKVNGISSKKKDPKDP